MASLPEKKQLIFENEQRFANAVSAAVVEKPKLSIWMILIPVIFIHYFYRLQKYAEGRKAFTRNFLLTRQRALDEAAAAVESDRKPNPAPVVQMASIPGGTAKAYIRWLNVLLDHYADLLKSEGDSYDALIGSLYRSKTNYLLFLNSLNDVEKGFDRELKPHLSDTPGAGDIINAIESACAELRRAEAQRIFS